MGRRRYLQGEGTEIGWVKDDDGLKYLQTHLYYWRGSHHYGIAPRSYLGAASGYTLISSPYTNQPVHTLCSYFNPHVTQDQQSNILTSSLDHCVSFCMEVAETSYFILIPISPISQTCHSKHNSICIYIVNDIFGVWQANTWQSYGDCSHL